VGPQKGQDAREGGTLEVHRSQHSQQARWQQAHTRKRVPTALPPHTYGLREGGGLYLTGHLRCRATPHAPFGRGGSPFELNESIVE
jgi:hypothetical protein